MSQPAPHFRARERQDKGQQPFKDAREAMGQKQAELQADAQELEGLDSHESDDVRAERLKLETAERLKGAQRQTPETSTES